MRTTLAIALVMALSGAAQASSNATLPSRYLPPVPVGTAYNVAHMGLLGLGYFPARKSACMARTTGYCEAVYENNCNEAFVLRMRDGHVIGARGLAPLHPPRAALCEPTGIEGRD